MRVIAILGALLIALPPVSWAAQPLFPPLSGPVLYGAPVLAQADTVTPAERAVADPGDKRAYPERRWITPNKLHQYLGVGALLLGFTAAATAGLAEEDEEGTVPGQEDEKDGGAHGAIAIAATALATGAVATGFLFHHEDVGFDRSVTDPDNLHMALTAIGTAGFITATALEGEDGHSIAGMMGGLAMLAGIKVTW